MRLELEPKEGFGANLDAFYQVMRSDIGIHFGAVVI